MLFFAIILISIKYISANEYIVKQSDIHYINQTTDFIQEKIFVNERKTIHTYHKEGSAILDYRMSRYQKDELCQVSQHSVFFETTSHNFYKVVEEGMNDEIINMIHVKDGAYIITKQYKVYLYHYKEITPGQLQPLKIMETTLQQYVNHTHYQVPVLVYNPETNYVYLIFKQLIVYHQPTVATLNSVKLENLTSIIHAKSSQKLLFLLDHQNVHVFTIDPKTGHITQVHGIDLKMYFKEEAVYLLDLSIGGKQGQHLYVLNKNEGIVQITVWQHEDSISVIYNQDFGIIPVKNIIKMAQYNDENLIVLQKISQNRYKVLDYAIDIGKYIWFILNEYHINGQATDLDITKSFFIVRGIDSHTVYFHSIYKEFAPDQQHFPANLYAPKIFALDFYDVEFGHQGTQGTEHWHHDQVHELVIAVNDNYLISYPFKEIPPEISCFTEDHKNVGKIFTYQVWANITDCESKKDKGDVLSRDLIICGYEHNIEVKVIDSLFHSKSKKMGVLVGFIFICCVIFLLMVLGVVNYRKYKLRRQELYNQMQVYIEIQKPKTSKYAKIQLETAAGKDDKQFSIEDEEGQIKGE